MPKAQLLELHARRLGVIEEANLEFGDGFNVLTGETGAGKTLLLDALGLCLGEEASGTRHALGAQTRAAALFVRADGSEVALSREMSDGGRLRSVVDGAPSSAEALRTLARQLVVIHGQHDSLALRSRAEIVQLIDTAGHVDTTALNEVRRHLREAVRLRDSFGGDPSTRQRELDFAAFQIGELEAAKVASASELADDLEELAKLTALRDGQEALTQAVQEFDGDADDAALSRFASALRLIPEGAVYDDIRSDLADALVRAREGVRDLSALANPEMLDPRAITELDERVDVLQRVARKYGGTLASALTILDDLRESVERSAEDEERRTHIDQEISELEARERAAAQHVRAAREAAAADLGERVARQLSRVALANATVRLVVEGTDGADAQILFSANPGQVEGPLSSLASGGELSRVLLAISLETVHQDVVAVFDEIDAGLGGLVAQQIGECLAEAGRRQQVLAITHLASVAARANHHFVIEKFVEDATTKTRVRRVEGADRIREVARMLAGDAASTESLALASQLLENSL
jgi:DNA repair protein RecN (Recombination protein N)